MIGTSLPLNVPSMIIGTSLPLNVPSMIIHNEMNDTNQLIHLILGWDSYSPVTVDGREICPLKVSQVMAELHILNVMLEVHLLVGVMSKGSISPVTLDRGRSTHLRFHRDPPLGGGYAGTPLVGGSAHLWFRRDPP